MKLTDKQIAALRDGTEGATPGPWCVIIDDGGNPISGRPSVSASAELDCGIVHWDGFVQKYWRSARGDREIHANATHIARCDPDTIRALATEVLESRAEIEWLREALIVIRREQQSEAQAGTGEYQRGYDDCIAAHAEIARAALGRDAT